MSARKNVLEFGLVTTPVGLAPARRKPGATSPKLEFVTPEGEPVKQIYVDAEGKQYGRADLGRGVATADGFSVIDRDVLAVIDEETKLDAIEVLGFIDKGEITLDRIADQHYVQGQRGISIRALSLVAQALKRTGKAGVVKFSVGKVQRPGALIYREDGALVLYTLTTALAVVAPDEQVLAPGEAEVAGVELDLAEELIARLSVDDNGEPYTAALIDTITDERAAKQGELIEAALDGKVPTPSKKAKPTPPAQDFVGALSASIAAEAKKVGRERKAVAKKATKKKRVKA